MRELDFDELGFYFDNGNQTISDFKAKGKFICLFGGNACFRGFNVPYWSVIGYHSKKN